MGNTVLEVVAQRVEEGFFQECRNKQITVTYGDFCEDPQEIDFKQIAAEVIMTYRSHAENFSWKPLSSAPRSPDIHTPIYLLGFVPDNAAPHDPDSGVCVIWWEPDQEYWTSEAICNENDEVKPSHWLMQIQAPSVSQRGLAYERGFIPPQITDILENHKVKSNLLPCPCVFEEHEQVPQVVHGLMNSRGVGCEFAVSCPECDVSTPQFATEEEAVYCWNTRMPNVVQQLQIEELVNTLKDLKPALAVLQTMLEKTHLTAGAHKCVDLQMAVDMVLSQHTPQP